MEYDHPNMYQAAVEYINRGLAVFPVQARDKIPLTKNGCKDATTDAAQVKAWWQKWPHANIGIATGSKSGGLIVIDCDFDEDRGIEGYRCLEEWERDNGMLPDTWTVITGRGGYHFYYLNTSNLQIGNRAGILDGVDVRGEGGYVIAPPSINKDGNIYQWETAPEDCEITIANQLVLDFVQMGKRQPGETFSLPDKIEPGQRNNTLFRFACMLQAKGVSDQTILASVLSENQARCTEPLDDDEIQKIVGSVLKYDKGKPILVNSAGVATQDWREPQFELDKEGKIKQTTANIYEAITYDEELFENIKFNILSYSAFVCGSLPWEHKNMYREWTNADISYLNSYLEEKYGFHSRDKMREALDMVEHEHQFNPVVEVLERIHTDTWDGRYGHIENLLPDYLGVEKTEYATECMKVFMLGAICRAYYPGCKFDYMIVLVGKQGVGKSTFLRYLALNNAWFNDNFNTVEGDKAPEKLRGMWIVELAELLAAKKAREVESIKAFLTSTVDTYRQPYKPLTEQRPRMCVFAGTTNNDHFLTDRTGNRRYLPLTAREDHIKKSLFEDRDSIQADFENAWGEAMDIFIKADMHPSLTLPKRVQEEAEKRQTECMEEDVRVGMIQEWLDEHSEVDRVCVVMLYQEALGNEDRKPSRLESNDIHTIMMNDIKGWSRMKNNTSGRAKCGKYGVQICYERIRINDGFMDPDEDICFN